MGKKSTKTTSKTVYGNTTTTNPYVTSTTNNKGTTSVLNKGSAFDTINNFVNKNMDSLLEEYLNPTLNSVSNRAKMNSFANNLSNQTAKSLENDIVNPLSNRKMIRSSQATNMYNNLANTNSSQIASYANELLGNSQKETASMLTNLMLLYMNGYNALADTQRQSLSTSQGNAKKTNTTTEGGMDMSQMAQMAMQIAMLAAGL